MGNVVLLNDSVWNLHVLRKKDIEERLIISKFTDTILTDYRLP